VRQLNDLGAAEADDDGGDALRARILAAVLPAASPADASPAAVPLAGAASEPARTPRIIAMFATGGLVAAGLVAFFGIGSGTWGPWGDKSAVVFDEVPEAEEKVPEAEEKIATVEEKVVTGGEDFIKEFGRLRVSDPAVIPAREAKKIAIHKESSALPSGGKTPAKPKARTEFWKQVTVKSVAGAAKNEGSVARREFAGARSEKVAKHKKLLPAEDRGGLAKDRRAGARVKAPGPGGPTTRGPTDGVRGGGRKGSVPVGPKAGPGVLVALKERALDSVTLVFMQPERSIDFGLVDSLAKVDRFSVQAPGARKLGVFTMSLQDKSGTEASHKARRFYDGFLHQGKKSSGYELVRLRGDSASVALALSKVYAAGGGGRRNQTIPRDKLVQLSGVRASKDRATALLIERLDRSLKQAKPKTGHRDSIESSNKEMEKAEAKPATEAKPVPVDGKRRVGEGNGREVVEIWLLLRKRK
jgi:hypothetical protein